jgi:hypothetical protein
MTRAVHERTAPTDGSASDRVLLALADHFHEHCRCELLDGPQPCDACDVRTTLRAIREELLAWRATGRRLAQRRDEALANALGQVERRRGSCAECAGLVGLSRSLDA